MMKKAKTKRTILVPLDARGTGNERLNITGLLARYLHASVTGLFVADSRSLEAASLPFAFEISQFSAEERSLQYAKLTSVNRLAANKVGRRLMELSTQYMISVSFFTKTGELFDSAFAQPNSDILFFPRQTTQFRQARPIRADHLVEELVVYYDTSGQAKTSLKLAEQLCCNHKVANLTLVHEGALSEQALLTLLQRGIRPKLQLISTRDPLWLRSLHMQESALILVPRNKFASLSSPQLSLLFAGLNCQVLLIQ